MLEATLFERPSDLVAAYRETAVAPAAYWITGALAARIQATGVADPEADSYLETLQSRMLDVDRLQFTESQIFARHMADGNYMEGATLQLSEDPVGEWYPATFDVFGIPESVASQRSRLGVAALVSKLPPISLTDLGQMVREFVAQEALLVSRMESWGVFPEPIAAVQERARVLNECDARLPEEFRPQQAYKLAFDDDVWLPSQNPARLDYSRRARFLVELHNVWQEQPPPNTGTWSKLRDSVAAISAIIEPVLSGIEEANGYDAARYRRQRSDLLIMAAQLNEEHVSSALAKLAAAADRATEPNKAHWQGHDRLIKQTGDIARLAAPPPPPAPAYKPFQLPL